MMSGDPIKDIGQPHSPYDILLEDTRKSDKLAAEF